MSDPLLQPEKDRPGLPRVNGIQLHKNAIYFTNFAKQLLGRINLKGQVAGSSEIIESGIQADDFFIE
ncbi:hypothetical protein RC851_001608 [Vibrio alginolyticus]|nr:hypothetical protein [Vibrio alginolyticus]